MMQTSRDRVVSRTKRAVADETWLSADHLERHVHVAARGVRVGADLLMCFLRECRELGLGEALVLDAQLHRETEPAALARADRHRARNLRLGSVLLLLFADEVERAAEARGVTRGEEMLRRGGARLAGPAHLLGHRQIGLHRAVARFGVSVAAAGGGCGCREKWLDPVHGRVSC